MRAVAISMTAALLVMALLAGNCLSCPQMLLAMVGHQPSHSCCPHGKTAPTVDCRTQALRHFVKADSDHSAQVLSTVDVIAPALIRLEEKNTERVVPRAATPPTLTSLRV